MIHRVSADFLIIGSGIAGLRAAVELASHGRVLILTKADPRAGSTGYAQGGIAAAVGDDDSVDLHLKDTLGAGDGLCDLEAVRVLVSEGPRYVRELIAWGADFDRRPDGSLDLAREGAHSVRRVLHAKDATGREIARVLGGRLNGLTSVELHDHAVAVQAIVEGGVVTGVRFLDARTGALNEARASATLLATGGAGQVFRETTNPAVASGDGVALAYLAGARVADLEFVQFHPTVLAVPGAPRYLLSEALRGEGARLVNATGQAFMSNYEPDGDLAARDKVARAMLRESDRTAAPVYLSLAHLPAAYVHERFPVIAAHCRELGLDLATDRLPVGPAAHYVMGGVVTDLDGRTSIPGLFAAGEVAMTGVHGANRLASNSLLEGLVFGGRAGQAMQASRHATSSGSSSDAYDDPAPVGESLALTTTEGVIRDRMWQQAGVFRDEPGLTALIDTLDGPWNQLAGALGRGAAFNVRTWRTASLLTVARLIARAALRRQESRGGHYRLDFPAPDDARWRRHVVDERGAAPVI